MSSLYYLSVNCLKDNDVPTALFPPHLSLCRLWYKMYACHITLSKDKIASMKMTKIDVGHAGTI